MSDVLQAGNTWLGTVLQSHASRTVTYSRGSTTLTTVTATKAGTDFGVSGDIVLTDWQGQDWIIDIAELAATFTVPARGDKITDGSDVFEVMAPEGLREWRYSDPYQLRFRVHTKEVNS